MTLKRPVGAIALCTLIGFVGPARAQHREERGSQPQQRAQPQPQQRPPQQQPPQRAQPQSQQPQRPSAGGPGWNHGGPPEPPRGQPGGWQHQPEGRPAPGPQRGQPGWQHGPEPQRGQPGSQRGPEPQRGQPGWQHGPEPQRAPTAGGWNHGPGSQPARGGYPVQQRAQPQARAWQQQNGWRQQGGWQAHPNWQGHRATNWQADHRTWGQRGGYGGYYIPQDRFERRFGRDHFFRIRSRPTIYMGYPRFRYGGFSFMMVDPWPEYWSDNWYASDDVYVDYEGDGYYLFNSRFPDAPIAVTVVL